VCALALPEDFQLVPLDADADVVRSAHRHGRLTIFRAGKLAKWQFLLDDRVLCICGSPGNRERLAEVVFGCGDGGEGRDRFGSHHDLDGAGFPLPPVGRPVFLYNGDTGICGRIYGYGNFIALPREDDRGVSPVRPSRIGVRRPGRSRVHIEGGTFLMGSPGDETYHGDPQPAEHPRHPVRLGGFRMDATPVTQAEYVALMGVNPSSWRGDELPVVDVTWYDAVLFCNARSRRDGRQPVYRHGEVEGRAGEGCRNLVGLEADFERDGYRLPTEAEWEYACRAGSTTRFFWGEEMDGDFAWSEINTDARPRPVGLKKPNAWGLHDMAGNVQEWCHDWFDGGYYASSPPVDPRGPTSGDLRVLRGGSNYPYKDRDRLRSANRSCSPPDRGNRFCGFRTVTRG
jgi:formylglycine-generating enzyme required for sulfatase activity